MADATALLPRERLARLTKRIHALGPRPLLELLLELQDGAPLAGASTDMRGSAR